MVSVGGVLLSGGVSFGGVITVWSVLVGGLDGGSLGGVIVWSVVVELELSTGGVITGGVEVELSCSSIFTHCPVVIFPAIISVSKNPSKGEAVFVCQDLKTKLKSHSSP